MVNKSLNAVSRNDFAREDQHGEQSIQARGHRLDKDSVGLTPEHGPALGKGAGGERAARRIQPNFG